MTTHTVSALRRANLAHELATQLGFSLADGEAGGLSAYVTVGADHDSDWRSACDTLVASIRAGVLQPPGAADAAESLAALVALRDQSPSHPDFDWPGVCAKIRESSGLAVGHEQRAVLCLPPRLLAILLQIQGLAESPDDARRIARVYEEVLGGFELPIGAETQAATVGRIFERLRWALGRMNYKAYKARKAGKERDLPRNDLKLAIQGTKRLHEKEAQRLLHGGHEIRQTLGRLDAAVDAQDAAAQAALREQLELDVHAALLTRRRAPGWPGAGRAHPKRRTTHTQVTSRRWHLLLRNLWGRVLSTDRYPKMQRAWEHFLRELQRSGAEASRPQSVDIVRDKTLRVLRMAAVRDAARSHVLAYAQAARATTPDAPRQTVVPTLGALVEAGEVELSQLKPNLPFVPLIRALEAMSTQALRLELAFSGPRPSDLWRLNQLDGCLSNVPMEEVMLAYAEAMWATVGTNSMTLATELGILASADLLQQAILRPPEIGENPADRRAALAEAERLLMSSSMAQLRALKLGASAERLAALPTHEAELQEPNALGSAELQIWGRDHRTSRLDILTGLILKLLRRDQPELGWLGLARVGSTYRSVVDSRGLPNGLWSVDELLENVRQKCRSVLDKASISPAQRLDLRRILEALAQVDDGDRRLLEAAVVVRPLSRVKAVVPLVGLRDLLTIYGDMDAPEAEEAAGLCRESLRLQNLPPILGRGEGAQAQDIYMHMLLLLVDEVRRLQSEAQADPGRERLGMLRRALEIFDHVPEAAVEELVDLGSLRRILRRDLGRRPSSRLTAPVIEAVLRSQPNPEEIDIDAAVSECLRVVAGASRIAGPAAVAMSAYMILKLRKAITESVGQDDRLALLRFALEAFSNIRLGSLKALLRPRYVARKTTVQVSREVVSPLSHAASTFLGVRRDRRGNYDERLRHDPRWRTLVLAYALEQQLLGRDIRVVALVAGVEESTLLSWLEQPIDDDCGALMPMKFRDGRFLSPRKQAGLVEAQPWLRRLAVKEGAPYNLDAGQIDDAVAMVVQRQLKRGMFSWKPSQSPKLRSYLGQIAPGEMRIATWAVHHRISFEEARRAQVLYGRSKNLDARLGGLDESDDRAGLLRRRLQDTLAELEGIDSRIEGHVLSLDSAVGIDSRRRWHEFVGDTDVLREESSTPSAVLAVCRRLFFAMLSPEARDLREQCWSVYCDYLEGADGATLVERYPEVDGLSPGGLVSLVEGWWAEMTKSLRAAGYNRSSSPARMTQGAAAGSNGTQQANGTRADEGPVDVDEILRLQRPFFSGLLDAGDREAVEIYWEMYSAYLRRVSWKALLARYGGETGLGIGAIMNRVEGWERRLKGTLIEQGLISPETGQPI